MSLVRPERADWSDLSITSQSHLGRAASKMNFLLVVLPLVALIIQAPTGTADSEGLDTTETPKLTHLVTVYHCPSWSSFINHAYRVFDNIQQKIPDKNFELKLKPEFGEFDYPNDFVAQSQPSPDRIVQCLHHQAGIGWSGANLDSRQQDRRRWNLPRPRFPCANCYQRNRKIVEQACSRSYDKIRAKLTENPNLWCFHASAC